MEIEGGCYCGALRFKAEGDAWRGVILKVGTLDDPGVYGGPQMAIYTMDK